MSTQDTTSAFLAALLADTTDAPVTAQVIQEMQEELAQRSADEVKAQLRSLASTNSIALEKLRDLDRRRKQAKDALDRISALAKAVVEGTLDTSEASFHAQLTDASMLRGKSICV